MITTYDYIDSNRRKTVLLILLFPISLFFLLFIALFFYSYIDLAANKITDENIIIYIFCTYWYYLFLPIILSMIWTVIAFYHGNYIILNYLHATLPKEEEYKDTKRIIENVSITAGIKPPTLYIMEREMSLNAFTVGTSPEKSCIVLTYGIIEKLERSELEAVIAHEVAHILYQDTKLMMAIILMIGFFTFAGSFLIGGLSSNKSNKVIQKGKGAGGIIIIIGLVLYIYGNLIAPAIRLAISRTRESHADAKAALLTRNPQGLISALKKIAGHPIIDLFNSNEIMAPMCIVSPLRIPVSLFDSLSNLSSTHPPIQERIKALEVMDGRSIDF
ncbi:MAG: M48 family metalloprotease [Endomicrobiaceae bacterium]|nr:M48 family metalloprotease [Endomicrobiaceae bacterium]